ncbi:phosphotransferase family protein [Novosphingobium mathurense]|uniref:Predicted kinase, aminoglycoside phosphotransferase (APT) family n=1 Tax=Novosphingobium mathurense TaxID=428990 RepID=A0A1U6HUU6_9SPHN|nr:phosphotransferase family protein [Novosphingobium mathurense]SLJ99587.1 Predicted kinase, aminoglycoside phosphotransferase (APT) family [Novosphingobium mathurense]
MTADIEHALAQCAGAAATIANLKRLTGGASLETWAYDEVSGRDVRPLILRRRRAGDGTVFETSLPLATEAALLALAAEAGVPVAKPIYGCDMLSELGEAYVMERVEGVTLGRKIVASEEFAPARLVLGRQCGAALARIHAISTDRAPVLERLDAAASLDRYEAIYRKGEHVRPVIEAAVAWLRDTIPAPVEPVLVHGDFRNGNLIVDPACGLVAVLDWELAHSGDPAEDLGWLCVNSWRFGETSLQVGGFAPLDELFCGYEQAGGKAPSIERIRWWQAMGTLKWATVTMMMYRTFASGESRSVERAVIGRRLSECEVDLLALMDEDLKEQAA